MLDEAHACHRAKLNKIRAVVDTRPPVVYNHLRVNRKKQQMLFEEQARIQRANLLLVDKMRSIIKTSTAESFGGQTVNAGADHQQQQRGKQHQQQGQQQQGRTFHSYVREKENQRIAKENERILQRIISAQPVYSVEQWKRDAKLQRERRDNACKYPSLESSSHSPRPGAAFRENKLGIEDKSQQHSQQPDGPRPLDTVLKALGTAGFTPRLLSSNVPVLPPISGRAGNEQASGDIYLESADVRFSESKESGLPPTERFGPVPIRMKSQQQHPSTLAPYTPRRPHKLRDQTGAGSWHTITQADPVVPYPLTKSPRRATALDVPTGLVDQQWQYQQAAIAHSSGQKLQGPPPKPMLTVTSRALPLGALSTEELLLSKGGRVVPGRGPGPSVAQLRALFSKRPSPRQVLFEDDVDVSGRFVRMLVREYVEPSWLIEIRAFDFLSGNIYTLKIPVQQLKQVFLGAGADDTAPTDNGEASTHTPASRLYDPASRGELVDLLIRCCRFVIKIPPTQDGHRGADRDGSRSHRHTHSHSHSLSAHGSGRPSSRPQGKLVMCLDLEPRSSKTTSDVGQERPSDEPRAHIVYQPPADKPSSETKTTDDASNESQVSMQSDDSRPFYFVDEGSQLATLSETAEGAHQQGQSAGHPHSPRSSVGHGGPQHVLPTPKSGKFTVFTPRRSTTGESMGLQREDLQYQNEHEDQTATQISAEPSTLGAAAEGGASHDDSQSASAPRGSVTKGTAQNTDGLVQTENTHVVASVQEQTGDTQQPGRRSLSSAPQQPATTSHRGSRQLRVDIEEGTQTSPHGSPPMTGPANHPPRSSAVSIGTDPMTPAAVSALLHGSSNYPYQAQASQQPPQPLLSPSTAAKLRPTHSLSVQVSCRNLPRSKRTGKICNPCIQVYARNLSGDWYPTGQRTERIEGDADPDFTTLLELEYNPKGQTEFAFSVFDVEDPEEPFRARLSGFEAQRAAERAKTLAPQSSSEVLGSTAISVNDLIETKGQPLGVRLMDASGSDLANGGQALLIIMTRALSYDE